MSTPSHSRRPGLLSRGARPGWGQEIGLAVHRHRTMSCLVLGALILGSRPGFWAPPPAGDVSVLVAQRDLSAGTVLVATDLRVAAVPAGVVPAGVLHQGAAVLGRQLNGALRQGELLTDARLLGPGLLVGLPPGQVATPVRIADSGSVSLLRAGDQIDVLATSTGTAGAEPAGHVSTVAAAATVLAVPDGGDRGAPASTGFGFSSLPATDAAGLADGALVVLATTPTTAADLARAAVTARLSVTLVADDGRVGG